MTTRDEGVRDRARPRTNRRRGLAWLAVLGLTLVLAACSGAAANEPGVATLSSPGASDASPTPAPTQLDPEDAILAYAECMRENGVDMPDPQIQSDGSGRGRVFAIGGGGAGSGEKMFEDPDFEAAQEKCQPIMEQGMGDRVQGEIPADVQDAMLEYAQCMREHGVDMPDPDFSQGAVRMRIDARAGLDPNSATFQEAQDACDEILANVMPGGGPASGTVDENTGGESGPGLEIKP